MYLVTKAVLKHMPNKSGGRIINISSVLGKLGVPGYAAYGTTNHGIIGFTQALALEVVDPGIPLVPSARVGVDTEIAILGIKQTVALQGITPEHSRLKRCRLFRLNGFSTLASWQTWFAMSLQNKPRDITGQGINICSGQTMI